jgi:hypothetical protein
MMAKKFGAPAGDLGHARIFTAGQSLSRAAKCNIVA